MKNVLIVKLSLYLKKMLKMMEIELMIYGNAVTLIVIKLYSHSILNMQKDKKL
tara:strand:- start:738 stop:896 length:159 start_codon:yes stop_codon:yes gene_type:complete